MEPSDLMTAFNDINRAHELASRHRRKTSVITKFIYRPNYDHYTDEQVHAELVHAETLLILSLISFLCDQSIICLVRGAFRIRTCYYRYKECLYILDTKKNWSSSEAREHFESGVRLGHGTFNLLMSYLPRRVLRILEYVGFSGNRKVAISELDRSIELNDGLRSVVSGLIVLTFHSYIENIFGLGHYDTHKVEQVSEIFLHQHPDSAFFLLFKGRYHQMHGQLEEAIVVFRKAIEAQNDWVQLHSICHWEIMWCYAVQMDWNQAAYYADLLRKRSKWSPASYTYQYATFKYAQLVEEQRKSTLDEHEVMLRSKEISEMMEIVPKLRVRLAGKTVPAEKFAITRAAKFLDQSNRLTLPALEFLYIWNIFVTLRNSPRIVEKLLARINSEIAFIECKLKQQQLEQERQNLIDRTYQSDNISSNSSKSSGHSTGDLEDEDSEASNLKVDDLCLALLLKAMCLRQLNRFEEAEICLERVIDSEDEICQDTFIVPHSIMELAQLKLEKQDYEEARKLIRIARNDHTGYLHETMVHFKLHAISRLLRMKSIDQQLVHDSLDSEMYGEQNQ